LPDQEIIVPPSVAVLGAISLNDSVGAPWFAPAGMTRGRLTTALQPVINFDEPTIDNLYINNINPLYATTNIKQLSPAQTSGVVIWGQKTLLLSTESSLGRIAVRRLLIDVRKAVRQIALQFLFEPNVERVSTVFASQITEYLSSVRARNGLQSFNVNIESPLKSRQNVENNLLKGKIYLQPPKTLEFVSLDFIISNGLQSEI
jgi:phage tail sheath protein FI